MLIKSVKVQFAAALLTTIVAALLAASTASAVPLPKSRPFQAVCEAQGGTFETAFDYSALYCIKAGGADLYTAFTPKQLDRQRKLCQKHYRAFFGVQGETGEGIPDRTRTFCSSVF
jgi:hypothetical protein